MTEATVELTLRVEECHKACRWPKVSCMRFMGFGAGKRATEADFLASLDTGPSGQSGGETWQDRFYLTHISRC